MLIEPIKATKLRLSYLFLLHFECADIEQILEWHVVLKKVQREQELNLGLLMTSQLFQPLYNHHSLYLIRQKIAALMHRVTAFIKMEPIQAKQHLVYQLVNANALPIMLQALVILHPLCKTWLNAWSTKNKLLSLVKKFQLDPRSSYSRQN